MPRDRPIISLFRAVADADHVFDFASGFVAALRFPSNPARAQGFFDDAGQLTARLYIQRLVDRFVGHPHLRIVGKIKAQSARDLRRAVVLF
ncbi:Uncharacterised protein [Mycobacteroides abscessus subsp. abscessus]|nr:Uncharacterised protein [Mycobacteroides abscessus subsp. abscessus]